MNFKSLLFLSLSLELLLVAAQTPQSGGTEQNQQLTINHCSAPGSCTPETYRMTLDANYRSACPGSVATGASAASCTLNQVSPYNTVSGSGTQLSLAAARLYLLNTATNKYQQFYLLGQEITFTVDVSALGCQDVSALYFVNMPADGLLSGRNSAGAPFGTGYCDANCAGNRYKFVDGYNANNAGSACCSEMDVWEGNSISNQLTTHSCGNYADCGSGVPGAPSCPVSNCDQAGCYYNTHKAGATFYSSGNSAVDTSQPLTVITRFFQSGGTLTSIERIYTQNGKTIGSPQNLTTAFCASGSSGLSSFGQTLAGGMSLVISAFTNAGPFLDECTSAASNTGTVTFKDIAYGPIYSTSSTPSTVSTATTGAATTATTATATTGVTATTGTATTGSTTGCSGSQNVVYSDSLAAAWTDYTSSSVAENKANTSPVHSGTYSISYGLSNYNQLYFHSVNTFQIGTYPNVQFWVNGGSLTISNALWVQFYDSSNQITGQRAVVSVTANTWTQVNINALAAAPGGCGLTSSTVVSGFLIQYTSSNAPGTIYVDDISLTSGCSSTAATATTGSGTAGSSSGTSSSPSCTQYTVSGLTSQSSWTTGSVWQFSLHNGGSGAPSSVTIDVNAGGYVVSNGGNMASAGSSGNDYFFTISGPSSFTAGTTSTYTFQVNTPSPSLSVTVSSCS